MDLSSSDPEAPDPADTSTTSVSTNATMVDDLMRLAKEAPPVIDPRPLDELLGYGSDGLPH